MCILESFCLFEVRAHFENGFLSFWSPEAALLLVSTKNRDLWPSPTTFRFEWLCKHNRLRQERIRFVRVDSEHAQSDGKS